MALRQGVHDSSLPAICLELKRAAINIAGNDKDKKPFHEVLHKIGTTKVATDNNATASVDSANFRDITEQDVIDSIREVVDALKGARGPTRAEAWLKKLNNFVLQVSPVVEAAASTYSGAWPASVVWAAIKVILHTMDYDAVQRGNPSALKDEIHPSSKVPSPARPAFEGIVVYLTEVCGILHSKSRAFLKGITTEDFSTAKTKLVQQFRAAEFEGIAQRFKEASQFLRDHEKSEVEYRRHQDFLGLLSRLHFVNFDDDLSRMVQPRLKDTCAWTLMNPTVRTWLDADTDSGSEGSRLWLYGGPGIGKSTLAAYLVEQSRAQRTADQVVLYFFCDAKDPRKRASAPIIKTLLAQILTMEDRCAYMDDIQVLLKAILSKSHDYPFSVIDLGSHLETMLSSFTTVRIILDGIDECDDEVTAEGGLLDLLESCNRRGTKLLYLSRTETHVSQRTKSWPSLHIGQTGTTEVDLQRYVGERLEQLQKRVPRIRNRQSLGDEIYHAAAGMFLYVRVITDHIAAMPNPTAEEVNNALHHSSAGLDQMYESYFEVLFRRNKGVDKLGDIAIRTLQWILFTAKPLQLHELNAMLATEPDYDDALLHHDIQEVLTRSLGVLIDFAQDETGVYYVRLVHQSLKEFLTRHRSSLCTSPILESLFHYLQPAIACRKLLLTCSIILASPSLLYTLHHQRLHIELAMLLEASQGRAATLAVHRRLHDTGLYAIRASSSFQTLPILDCFQRSRAFTHLLVSHDSDNIIRKYREYISQLQWSEDNVDTIFPRFLNLTSERLEALYLSLQCVERPTAPSFHSFPSPNPPKTLPAVEHCIRHLPFYISTAITSENHAVCIASLLATLFVNLDRCSQSALRVIDDVSVSCSQDSRRFDTVTHATETVDIVETLQLLVTSISTCNGLSGSPKGVLTCLQAAEDLSNLARKIIPRHDRFLDTGIHDVLEHELSSCSFTADDADFVFVLVHSLAHTRAVFRSLQRFDQHVQVLIGMSNLLEAMQNIQNDLAWLLAVKIHQCCPSAQKAKISQLVSAGRFDIPGLVSTPSLDSDTLPSGPRGPALFFVDQSILTPMFILPTCIVLLFCVFSKLPPAPSLWISIALQMLVSYGLERGCTRRLAEYYLLRRLARSVLSILILLRFVWTILFVGTNMLGLILAVSSLLLAHIQIHLAVDVLLKDSVTRRRPILQGFTARLHFVHPDLFNLTRFIFTTLAPLWNGIACAITQGQGHLGALLDYTSAIIVMSCTLDFLEDPGRWHHSVSKLQAIKTELSVLGSDVIYSGLVHRENLQHHWHQSTIDFYK
ncbi:hypothetical protein IEO21_03859 [Rhodonia placenta]|uniref:NACHT domain-containing protein n=1 Tax=Rhodonia placenta TaxID=104341 RepID=A0A8H7U3T2_9APHY|nr:hypothetical protein IEO21_03859 [Postia placenta]